MKVIKNATELKTLINAGKPILLDFYADWCGPCQTLMPTVEKLAEKHKEDFNIVKVNVDQSQELASQFGVRSIPALFFIENGKISEHLSGVQTEAILDQKIHSYLAKA